MRHRRQGRKLGRNPNHQRALLRNLASALILTERDADGRATTPPKVKGRIITTLEKAKEVRPLVERCITIARRALPHQEAADALASDAERHSEKWRAWRQSERWSEWNQAMAPVVAARRRAAAPAGRQAGRAHPLQRHCPPLRRSSRRLHPRAAPGQAAAGRRRHPGDPRTGRRPRSQAPPRRPARPSRPSRKPPRRRERSRRRAAR